MSKNDFYCSKRWKQLRKAVLQRDGYECQLAKMQGKHEPADTVHHIFPRSQFPEYQFQSWNLISLSRANHNRMHIRDTDLLTERGELLRKETAERQGIDIENNVIVIIGMPGSGKTTYAKKNLKNGVVYDLDAIAGALRLKKAKTENHKAARWLANSLFDNFAEAAKNYSRRVLIIRTAPTVDDLIKIDPSEIVVCRGGYGNEELSEERRHSLAERIKDATTWAELNGVKVKEIGDDNN